MPLDHKRCYVIAEIGSNHMGDYKSACEHIAKAALAGADAAKFQLFRPEDIAKDASRVDPRTVLPPEWIPGLAGVCREHRIDFLCTPFAPWAVDVLLPHVWAYKIGSFEWKRNDVWEAVKATGKPIIASNGRGDSAHRANHTLHCVSKYPAAEEDIYLPAFDEQAVCGFSDHTKSVVLPALAVARGAHIIEKHIVMYYTAEDSPDYPHSLLWTEFRNMVRNIRLAESATWRNPPADRILEVYENRREE